MLYFPTNNPFNSNPFNLLYILLLLGFKTTSIIWIIMIDILMIAIIISPHKTIHKIKTVYKSIKFPIFKLYLIYLIFYSAKNVFNFEPFFYEGLYISSKIPFLFVFLVSLYLGLKNLSGPVIRIKKSIDSYLEAKKQEELEEIRKRKERAEQSEIEEIKKYKALSNLVTEQLDTRKQFEYELLYKEYKPNTLLTVKRERNKNNKERIVGAAMFINAEQLKYNNDRIHIHKNVERSDESRRAADVPGYDFLAKKFNYTDENNKRIFIWQRTHLVPFRHTLSEGDTIDNLLFAGTAHLNSGNRPDIDYDVFSREEEIDGRPQRKKDLREMFSLNLPIEASDENQFEKYYNIEMPHNITVPGAPEGSYYSLADVEEVVDEIILDNPNADFAYGTILEYENDYLLAPRWCTAILINKTLNKIVFYIKLSNVK